jgi:hypothetical protein
VVTRVLFFLPFDVKRLVIRPEIPKVTGNLYLNSFLIIVYNGDQKDFGI